MTKEDIKEKAIVVANNTTGFFKRYWRWFAYGFIAIMLFVAGWVACVRYGANVVKVPEVTVKEIPVTIPVTNESNTTAQYVEKSPNDADVEITNSVPQVVMKYNDETYSFDTVDNEDHKFDKGKLVVDTKSSTTLDVTPIVDREVKTAVENNTKTITEQKDKEKDVAVQTAKENSHKAIRKDTTEGFLAGALTGAAVVLLF